MGKATLTIFIALHILFLVNEKSYAQIESSLAAGLEYNIYLEKNNNDFLDTHSFDITINNYTSYVMKKGDKISFGLFANTDILLPNPIFPTVSHFIIYDFSIRFDTTIGPCISASWGEKIEPYFGMGLNFLETLISHNEQSSYYGDIHYERFGFTMGIGFNPGVKFHFKRTFLNFGGTFAYEFLNWTSFKSKFGDYSGWTENYAMYEIKLYLTMGFSITNKKKGG
jgi:hypothetical protein